MTVPGKISLSHTASKQTIFDNKNETPKLYRVASDGPAPINVSGVAKSMILFSYVLNAGQSVDVIGDLIIVEVNPPNQSATGWYDNVD